MELRTKQDPNKCAVARCRRELFEVHTYPNDTQLCFCKEHGHLAAKEAGEERIEIKICSLEFPPEEVKTETAVSVVPKPAQSLGTGEVLTQAQMERLQSERARAEEEIAELKEFQIETAEEAQFGESELARVRDAWKAWETERTSVTQPMNKALKGINSWFKPTQSALKALEGSWTRSLNDYRLRVAEEQKRLLEAAQEAEKPEEIREALIQASEIVPDTGAGYIDNWQFEIVDPSVLPREYLCPDVGKIGSIVKTLGEGCQIPGVRVWNKPTIRPKR